MKPERLWRAPRPSTLSSCHIRSVKSYCRRMFIYQMVHMSSHISLINLVKLTFSTLTYTGAHKLLLAINFNRPHNLNSLKFLTQALIIEVSLHLILLCFLPWVVTVIELAKIQSGENVGNIWQVQSLKQRRTQVVGDENEGLYWVLYL